MNELLQALQLHIASITEGIRKRANTALAALPPLEQVEGAESVLSALREFRWVNNQIADMQEHIERLGSEKFLAEVQQAHRAALISDGFVTPDDHKDLLAQAAKSGKEEAETAHAAVETARALASTRREEARTTLGDAADALSAEQLAADNYRATIEKMEGRLASMKDAGVTAEAMPTAFASLSKLTLDDAGDAELKTRLAVFAEVKATAENKPKVSTGKQASAPELAGKTAEGSAATKDLVFA